MSIVNFARRHCVFTFAVLIFSLSFSGQIAGATKKKIETEELIKKHLESIGSAEARGAVTSLSAVGKVKVVSKGKGAGETVGIIALGSKGKKNMIGMKFDNAAYSSEKMGFDGEDFTVGFVQAGIRTQLGGFMLTNQKAFKVGIMGGVLSTAWELNNYDSKVGKLKCGGTKKIDGVKMHKCSYNPKKGSELKITLFFHPETFRHVRTEYRRVISGGQGLGVDQSARQSEVRYLLTENFGNFVKVGELTLPHDFTIAYERSGAGGSVDFEWRMELVNFYMNPEIADSDFKVDLY